MMLSSKVCFRLPGTAPPILLDLCSPERTDGPLNAPAVEPPRKRQKRKEEDISFRTTNPRNYITIHRLDIDLIYDEPSKTHHFAEHAQPVPVNIKTVNGIHSSNPVLTVTSIGHVSVDISIPSTLPLQACQILQKTMVLAASKQRNAARASFLLSRVPIDVSDTSSDTFRLQARILWSDSRFLDCNHPSELDCLLGLGASEQEQKHNESWVPGDFYDHLLVPDRHSTPSDSIQAGQLTTQLYPFQKRAVVWMLNREGVELSGDKPVPCKSDHREHTDGNLPHGFYQTIDADGRKCFVSNLLGVMTTHEELLRRPEIALRGGLLADDMGLGKTVELIALICLHKQPVNVGHDLGQSSFIQSSSATLIITPSSILQQWKDEIMTLAPTLKVYSYDGMRSKAVQDQNNLINRLSEQDVVLTTYSILAQEIHYSGAGSNHVLRHQKKYQRQQSPLTQLSWWRIILDEAQMVESGVSNAAKVARHIQGRSRWAVSGTPVQKGAKDLLGLLIFLQFEPYCNSSLFLWNRLVIEYKTVFREIFSAITLRHTKEHVWEDLQLPPQQRIVLTIPFTQIEEEHYSHLFQQMCADCGFQVNGFPLESKDTEASPSVEKMRSWLTRLRQTCLHPQVGTRNRQALGHTEGPLRTVDQVLEVMIDHNETTLRADERTLLLSILRRGQILEHAGHSQEALQIWLKALNYSRTIVNECRLQVLSHHENTRGTKDVQGTHSSRRLRSAIEIQHMCEFFTANAYYQLKTKEDATQVRCPRVKELEEAEEKAYERAKILRRELLVDTHGRAEALIATLRVRSTTKAFVMTPNICPVPVLGGIQSSGLLRKLDDLRTLLSEQASLLQEWREKMTELLILPLVDEEETELHGNEYETSKSQQDDAYVYMEVLRALTADRREAITGDHNNLIEGEMRFALDQAKEGAGHSPELLQRLSASRKRVRSASLGSLKEFLGELRAIKTALHGDKADMSLRTRAELARIDDMIQLLQRTYTDQNNLLIGLEKDLELFRDTMNARLEYYRQLQNISDSVAPYEKEYNEEARGRILQTMHDTESKLQATIALAKAKNRYLLHLRHESSGPQSQQMCIICQQSFEIGALTVCGHSYCRDCLQLWWSAHRSCPTCKKRLSKNDIHQITHKPRDLTLHEKEGPSIRGAPSTNITPNGSLYSAISNAMLSEIRNTDIDGSFGTKIDTLARHILWIRKTDPGAKSIIFSQYREFLDILAKAFAQFKITYASADKKDSIEKFKLNTECLFLCAHSSSSGLNLVNATHIILCEPLINTAIELQVIARVHRIGQHRPTTIWMYLVEDTVEKSIYEMSVARRMSHISVRNVEGAANSNESVLAECTIEAANSRQLRQVPLAKLLERGSGGGEMVRKDDLWNCLFGVKLKRRMQTANGEEP